MLNLEPFLFLTLYLAHDMLNMKHFVQPAVCYGVEAVL